MEQRNKFYLLSTFLFFVGFATWFLLPYDYHYDSVSSHTTAGRPSFTAPRLNVWAELSEHECADVYNFVFSELSHLNLVKQPKKGQDNFIHTIETLRPNKTNAARYAFDEGTLPQRWAKVVIAQNDGESFELVYHAVGPLPITKDTRILDLNYVSNSGGNRVRSPSKISPP